LSINVNCPRFDFFFGKCPLQKQAAAAAAAEASSVSSPSSERTKSDKKKSGGGSFSMFWAIMLAILFGIIAILVGPELMNQPQL
jgi:hypothetical protein